MLKWFRSLPDWVIVVFIMIYALTVMPGAVILTVWAAAKLEQKSEQHKRSDYVPTSGHLSVAYRELNEDYFYGGLPSKKTTIVLGDLTAQDDLGHIYQREDGSWVIVIDRKGHPVERQAEMTLIHEMCHQEVMIAGSSAGLDGHSGAFEACMESVANHGGFKDLW